MSWPAQASPFAVDSLSPQQPDPLANLNVLLDELVRLTPGGRFFHDGELRVGFHPGAGCQGPWTVEVVRAPLSRRPVAIGHGLTLEAAAAECAADWKAIR